MPYRFHDFEVDDALFVVRSGGRDVALRPQAFDVLLHLIAHRDRVVTKEELLATVWRGAAVSENTVPQSIVAIRRALDDSGEQPTIVQTIRGRGYRFVAEVEAYDDASDAEAPPSSTDTELAIVGRETELTTFETRLRRATASRGDVLLVTGETGAGKTRLLRAFAARANDLGARVALVTCHAIEGTPELRPWSSLLADLGLATLDDVEASGRDAADGARFVAFDRVVAALHASADARPLVLLVDDLHLADAPSILLLKLVAVSVRARRIVLVGAYRHAALATATVLARTVGALIREDPARLLHFANLEPADIRRLAERALARPLDPDELARLVEKTAGNPALLVSVLQAMQVTGGATTGGLTSTLLAKHEMRRAIGLHLEGISAELRSLLEAGAVLGTHVSLRHLAATMGRGTSELLPTLDEAERTRVLAVAGPGRYRFVHVLVRDVLYRELGAARRAALHELAGAAALADDPERAVDHLERALRILDRLADAPDVSSDDPAARGPALLRHLRGST